MDKQQFYSHGKFLLTGEYFILRGAKGLAIPLKLGQHLSVETTLEDHTLNWVSEDEAGKVWFEAQFNVKKKFLIEASTDRSVAENLQYLLKRARKMNKTPWKDPKGKKVSTKLTFNREWGMGSSSTNISNIARWLKIDAVQLNFLTSNGSGYDVAAAQINLPIKYYLYSKGQPVVETLNFSPAYAENVCFIFSGNKQNTQTQIKNFYVPKRVLKSVIPVIDDLTETFIRSTDIYEVETIIAEHEKIVGHALDKTPIKQTRFTDFAGAIKSIGAWGGDFFMAVSDQGQEYIQDYFKKQGFETTIPYKDIALYV